MRPPAAGAQFVSEVSADLSISALLLPSPPATCLIQKWYKRQPNLPSKTHSFSSQLSQLSQILESFSYPRNQNTTAMSLQQSVDVAMELKASALSSSAQILSDHSDPAFQASMSRWTEINKQIPAAILLPACEEDVQKIVRLLSLPPISLH